MIVASRVRCSRSRDMEDRLMGLSNRRIDRIRAAQAMDTGK
jgi:hypothetical protein